MYDQVKVYADEKKVSVDDFVVSLIRTITPQKNPRKKKYQMKAVEELSPVLQSILNMPRTGQVDANDINGDKARLEYYTDKYELA